MYVFLCRTLHSIVSFFWTMSGTWDVRWWHIWWMDIKKCSFYYLKALLIENLKAIFRCSSMHLMGILHHHLLSDTTWFNSFFTIHRIHSGIFLISAAIDEAIVTKWHVHSFWYLVLTRKYLISFPFPLCSCDHTARSLNLVILMKMLLMYISFPGSVSKNFNNNILPPGLKKEIIFSICFCVLNWLNSKL